MELSHDRNYYEGYLTGYRDGLLDAAAGRIPAALPEDLLSLPIKSMNLSARAIKCLSRSGCGTVQDAAALNDYAIANMRNMGKKTAAEVARWLNEHGVCGTAWQRYL